MSVNGKDKADIFDEYFDTQPTTIDGCNGLDCLICNKTDCPNEIKEIIIDGVNVWGCKHYDLENNYCDQSYLGEGGLLKNTKNPKRCEQSPNCYFKQLQRLKKELEIKEKQSEHFMIGSGEVLDKLKKENEKLKNKNNDLIEEIASGNIDIAILQKENEKLKKQLEFSRTHKTVLDAERIKYKQALEEIREIAKYNKFYDPRYFMIRGDIGQVQNIKMTEIYKKCSEVLNDRD